MFLPIFVLPTILQFTTAGMEALSERIDQISGSKCRLKKDKEKGKRTTEAPVVEEKDKMENVD